MLGALFRRPRVEVYIIPVFFYSIDLPDNVVTGKKSPQDFIEPADSRGKIVVIVFYRRYLPDLSQSQTMVAHIAVTATKIVGDCYQYC